jgi:SAM-dependent methyltransferase
MSNVHHTSEEQRSEPPTSWAFGTPMTSPFAVPRGFAGWLAGAILAITNDAEQRDAAALAAVRPGERVLEIGYGPGQLTGMLLAAGAAEVAGVDPSPEMQRMATRRTKKAGGRADLRVGTADRTGFPDGRFDIVVSVNTIVMWPDLGAGLDEICRVLCPGGRAVIAWHGGRNPTRMARHLVLGEEVLARIEVALHERFDDVQRHELRLLTAFTGTRPAA